MPTIQSILAMVRLVVTVLVDRAVGPNLSESEIERCIDVRFEVVHAVVIVTSH